AAVALPEPPRAAFPAFVLLSRDPPRQIHALQPRPLLRPLQHRRDVEPALGIMCDHRVGRAADADTPGQRAGVDTREADLALVLHPLDELALGAEARVARHFLANDAAD